MYLKKGISLNFNQNTYKLFFATILSYCLSLSLNIKGIINLPRNLVTRSILIPISMTHPNF